MESYKWQAVPIDSEHCPRDLELEELIHKYKSHTDEIYGRVVTRFTRKLTHPSRIRETELGDLFSDILKNSLGVDMMLLGSGSIRIEELGPVVLYEDLCEAFPYDDEVYMCTIYGALLKKMLRFMLRDEVWAGAHCEFYQLSEGMQIVYSKEKHDFITFTLNGNAIEDEKKYTIGLQRFHYLNTDIGFGVTMDEISEICKPRIVTTSCREVLDEYLSTHQRIDQKAGDRLIII